MRKSGLAVAAFLAFSVAPVWVMAQEQGRALLLLRSIIFG